MGEILALLLIGHALCDDPSPGEWLSRAKNFRIAVMPGEVVWPAALASHAAIRRVDPGSPRPPGRPGLARKRDCAGSGRLLAGGRFCPNVRGFWGRAAA
jgi:hypothetical protein